MHIRGIHAGHFLCILSFEVSVGKEKGVNSLDHNRVIHGQHPLHCARCDKRFNSSSGFKKHTLQHEQPTHKNFKCPHCPWAFSNGVNLRRHMSVHSSKAEIECEVCKRHFKRRDDLYQHLHRTKIGSACLKVKKEGSGTNRSTNVSA